ncbi:MAG: ATP-binding protein [Bacteroidales bacterium]
MSVLCQFLNLNAQVIKVGADYDYPPYSYIDDSGKPAGLDVDILNELEAVSNLEFDLYLMKWDSVLHKLGKGELDAVTGIIYSEKRRNKYDFSFPVHTSHYSIFGQKSLHIEDMNDLGGLNPVFLEGDIFTDEFAKPMGIYDDFKLVKSLPDAIMHVESGLNDYTIAPYHLGMEIIRQNNCGNVEAKGNRLFPVIYCLAVNSGNVDLISRINNGISTLRNNGSLKDLQDKWIRVEKKEQKYLKWIRYSLWSLGIFALVIIFVLLWVRLLRQQIRKATVKIRETEENYYNIFNSGRDAILVLDFEGNIIDANPLALEIYGYSYQEMVKLNGKDIVTSPYISLFREFLEKVKKGKAYFAESIDRKSDGSLFNVNVKGTVFNFKGGPAILAIIRDITIEKQSEKALIKARQEAEKANEAKSRFISTVTHELRTPLNAISGYIRLLLHKTNPNQQQADYILKLVNAASTMHTLIDNVLDVKKIESGHLVLEENPFQLSDILSKVRDLFSVQAESKNLDLVFKINIDTERTLLGDGFRLSQVLANLISNAIKFTDSGSVVIEVNEMMPSGNQKYVLLEFTVTDTGIGLSKEQLKVIFEPFSQADNSITRKYGGTGLGLSISKRLVALMGGELIAESTEGVGSTFKFAVRFTFITENKQARPPGKISNSEQSGLQVLRELRVLVVDDDEMNGEILFTQLSTRCARVEVAKSGQKAIEILKAEDFDLVLIDIRMPGIDGIETTKMIRQLPSGNDIIILGMSAVLEEEEKQDCLLYGMNGFLSKPVAITDVLQLITFSYSSSDSRPSNSIYKDKKWPGKLPEKVIDLDEALEIYDGEQEFFMKTLGKFMDDYRNVDKTLNDLMMKDKHQELSMLVHKLINASKLIGASWIVHYLRKVENMIKKGETEHLSEIMKIITEGFSRIIPSLEKIK